MRSLPLALVVSVCASATFFAQAPSRGVSKLLLQSPSSKPQTFTGIVTDSECDEAFHGAMRMGDTDAECARACVDAHGARFVLRVGSADPKVTYDLTDQKTPAKFAGQKVVVTGTLDAAKKMITVESVEPAR